MMRFAVFVVAGFLMGNIGGSSICSAQEESKARDSSSNKKAAGQRDRSKGNRIQSPGAQNESPADNLKVAKDFKLELLYTVPKQREGSWVAMCVDPKGRLIVGDQSGK